MLGTGLRPDLPAAWFDSGGIRYADLRPAASRRADLGEATACVLPDHRVARVVLRHRRPGPRFAEQTQPRLIERLGVRGAFVLGEEEFGAAEFLNQCYGVMASGVGRDDPGRVVPLYTTNSPCQQIDSVRFVAYTVVRLLVVPV